MIANRMVDQLAKWDEGPNLARLRHIHSYSDHHISLLRSMLDVVFRAIEPDLDQTREESDRDPGLIGYQLSTLPDYGLEQLAGVYLCLSKSGIDGLRVGLGLLGSRLGGYLLTRQIVPFDRLPTDQQESIVLEWSTSRLRIKRSLFSALVTFPLANIYNSSASLQRAVGYPSDGDPNRVHQPHRTRPSYRFDFLNVPTLTRAGHESEIPEIDTDFVIIGSGAGGSVVASLLAGQGLNTLVIEKGNHVPTEETSGRPQDGKQHYERSGQMTTSDGSMVILAGSAFGGATVINWSASLVTPYHIRKEWAEDHGLDYFINDSYSQDLARVIDRLGVSTKAIVHSKANQMLIEGCKKIGAHIDLIPQNTAGVPHQCGMCGYGCPFGEKQSATRTWLVDCSKSGGKFIQQSTIQRILFSDRSNPNKIDLENSRPSPTRKFAVGVLVRSNEDHQFIVRAHKGVICSAGAINTPAILLRSGLTRNSIGQGLHLHPAILVTGWFDSDINPWEGSIMTAISCEIENLNGKHHGAKIEVMASSPGVYAAIAVPWTSNKDHKKLMSKYKNSFSLVVIARDESKGKINIDKNDETMIDYQLNENDRKSLLEGILMCCRIFNSIGALEILTSQRDLKPYSSNGSLKFESWLETVRSIGVYQSWMPMGSAHQMSSCKMGSRFHKESVVDEDGKFIGFKKLWIADASVLPTSIGVNPMITIMAVSHSIGRKIIKHLQNSSPTEHSKL